MADDLGNQVQKLALRVEKHELQITSLNEYKTKHEDDLKDVSNKFKKDVTTLTERVDAKEAKIDKLSTRLVIILAFISGVLVVSTETGGNMLRTVIGALLT